MKRRSFFAAAGLAAAGAVSCSRPVTSAREKLFSFVFCNDIHLQPERGAPGGFRRAIGLMNAQRPDFVVCGGDMVMNSLAVDEARATVQWDLFDECAADFDVPVHTVIGNHEVFGITVPELVPESHPDWGKNLYRRRLGNGGTYTSFDHKGAHIVLLDSVGIQKRADRPGHDYIGEVGAEQLAWLEQDLAAVGPDTPVIAMSHIPVLTLYNQFVNSPTMPSPRSVVITDGRPLLETLTRHNLIGYMHAHIHVNEMYLYKGVRYTGSGAVSGDKWRGPRDGHPEGFTCVDVYRDGIESTYMPTGWDASVYADGADSISRRREFLLV